MEEEWKDIEGYEGYYQVSSLSRVRSVARYVQRVTKARLYPSKLLKPGCGKVDGYMTVALCKDNKCISFKVARLVAKAFIPNPKNHRYINHIDGNKLNDSIDNLEWCTQAHNLQHAVRTGLLKNAKGEDAGLSKLTTVDVLSIRATDCTKFGTMAELGRKYKVSFSTIRNIINKETWKHI